MAWTAREGVKNGARPIVQTPDGYLWLGSTWGLMRFDGVRFVPWSPPAGQHLPSRNIVALLAARDGTLWIGTFAGLVSWKNGRLIQYSELAGEPIFALLEDHQGTVWVGGVGNPAGKLCAILGGRAECHSSGGSLGEGVDSLMGNLGRGVYSLYEDSEHHLWAGTETGLWQWKTGPPQRYLPQPITSPEAVAPGDHGPGLIVISAGILRQIDGNKAEEYAPPGVRRPFIPSRLLRARDGALWIGTAGQGLLRVYGGKTTQFAHSDGLSGDLVLALFEDREGAIWVGTTNGLDRFCEPAISTISVNQGLSGPTVVSVLSARDSSLWIGTQDGVNRWNQGQMTIYRSANTLRTRFRAAQEAKTMLGRGGVSDALREITDAGLPGDDIGSLGEDQGGRIWVTSRDGAAWLENGRYHHARGVPIGPAIAIIADKHGGVWMAYPSDGLFHVVEGRVIESVPWPKLGPDPRVSAIMPDPVTDGLWLGFLNGGIAYFKDGQVGISLDSKNGLGGGTVWSLQIDQEGTLWAATEGGLSRVKDGRVATLTTKNGLPCDAVHWAMEDAGFSLWLSTPCGLVRVAQTELAAWSADSRRAIQTTIFDAADGVRIHPITYGYSPVVTKSANGKIWFANVEGVGVLDPLHVPLNKLPPPVHIEQITADRKPYDPSPGLHLPPRVRDLAIEYTALSLVAPEKVHFRFKLEGQDEDWREVVNVREVQYSNLDPRHYRFRVMASNNTGVWNETGDSFDFSIAPAYYQTTWFRLSLTGAFFVSLWGLYRYRLYQVASEFKANLEGRVDERLRVARDLHDTLLQSFQGSLLVMQTARNLLSRRPEQAGKTLDDAIHMASGAIGEGREAIQNLRSQPTVQSDLAQLLTATGQELVRAQDWEGNPVIFRVAVGGERQELDPMMQDEAYRIARELLRNAFRHAQASQIEAEIRYEDRLLRVLIRDDGKGIEPEIVTAGGRTGHWGLQGMRERAKRIGARLEFWSEAGAGTEVELSIPAGIAYGTGRGGGRFALFRKKKANP